MANDDKKKFPGTEVSEEAETRKERAGMHPEVGSNLDNTQFEVENALGGNLPELPEDPMAKSLREFMTDLEKEKNPGALEKVRKIRRTLLFVSRFVKADPEKIKLVRLPGKVAGKAEETHIKVDPVLFDNEDLTEDDLVRIRHVLLHELFHMEKDIDNEGLVELASSKAALDKIQDYEGAVHRVARITDLIGEHFYNGDKDAGVVEVLNLYEGKKYDELYAKFEEAHGASADGREALARNPQATEKVWQLAFPELIFDKEGRWVEDEEGCEKVEDETEEPEGEARAEGGSPWEPSDEPEPGPEA